LPKVAPLSLVLILLIVIYALLGMTLFGGKFWFPYLDGECGALELCAIPRANFDDFPTAMIVVFQVLTGEDWNVIFYHSVQAVGMSSFLYFVVVVVFGNYIVISLFVAILLEGFSVNDLVDRKDDATTKECEHDLNGGGEDQQAAQADETMHEAQAEPVAVSSAPSQHFSALDSLGTASHLTPCCRCNGGCS
jgi:hypothetical protein